jgi:hypothetical protein
LNFDQERTKLWPFANLPPSEEWNENISKENRKNEEMKQLQLSSRHEKDRNYKIGEKRFQWFAINGRIESGND